jgi:hypothetical protein
VRCSAIASAPGGAEPARPPSLAASNCVRSPPGDWRPLEAACEAFRLRLRPSPAAAWALARPAPPPSLPRAPGRPPPAASERPPPAESLLRRVSLPPVLEAPAAEGLSGRTSCAGLPRGLRGRQRRARQEAVGAPPAAARQRLKSCWLHSIQTRPEAAQRHAASCGVSRGKQRHSQSQAARSWITEALPAAPEAAGLRAPCPPHPPHVGST